MIMGKKIKCLYCGEEFDESQIAFGVYYETFCPHCGNDPFNQPREYKKAENQDLDIVYEIVQSSIKETYPNYYPQEVVDFFSNLHNKENIKKDIDAGLVGVLLADGVPVGTGCYKDDHISRVYVSPKHQGKGHGSYIMDCLERIIGPKYEEVYLDASLPACHMYEERGYVTMGHKKVSVGNGKFLVYEKMLRKFDPLYFM